MYFYVLICFLPGILKKDFPFASGLMSSDNFLIKHPPSQYGQKEAGPWWARLLKLMKVGVL